MGQQPAMAFETRCIGALPPLLAIINKLGFAKAIDDSIPWEGEIALGTLATVLVLNRLLRPSALVRVGEWAEQSGVAEYFGLTAAQLNDDLLGRALERIAKHYLDAQCQLVLTAVKKFGVNVGYLHFDISNIELFGSYDSPAQQATDGAPQPAYGHTKSGRKNVKQVQFGLNVTHGDGVPLVHLPLDGNAAETPVHLENFKLLSRVVPGTSVLYQADTKLDSEENLLTIRAAKGQFLCGGVFSVAMQKKFLEHRDQLASVDYSPKSQAHLPPEKRDRYMAFELPATISGRVNGRQVTVRYREVFVWSEGKARQEKATRDRHVEKIRVEFQAVERNLNKYRLKTREAIEKRLESVRGKYAEGAAFSYAISGRAGSFRLTWNVDEAEMKRLEQLAGAYVLKTDLAKKTHPTGRVLADYKSQTCVEQSIGYCKGPLAVAPVFLEKPSRIAGLICIVVWALLILRLMERTVRQSLQGEPMYGLYPENRPSPAPTGPSILRAFATLCIVIVKSGGRNVQPTRHLAEPSAVQKKLLQLLGIPPSHLETFIGRCGT